MALRFSERVAGVVGFECRKGRFDATFAPRQFVVLVGNADTAVQDMTMLVVASIRNRGSRDSFGRYRASQNNQHRSNQPPPAPHKLHTLQFSIGPAPRS